MLDAPVLTLTGPADIDELSVSAGPKGRDATSGESGGDVSKHQLQDYLHICSLALNTDSWFEKQLETDFYRYSPIVNRSIAVVMGSEHRPVTPTHINRQLSNIL
jgi:hypothetical protein